MSLLLAHAVPTGRFLANVGLGLFLLMALIWIIWTVCQQGIVNIGGAILCALCVCVLPFLRRSLGHAVRQTFRENHRPKPRWLKISAVLGIGMSAWGVYGLEIPEEKTQPYGFWDRVDYLAHGGPRFDSQLSEQIRLEKTKGHLDGEYAQLQARRARLNTNKSAAVNAFELETFNADAKQYAEALAQYNADVKSFQQRWAPAAQPPTAPAPTAQAPSAQIPSAQPPAAQSTAAAQKADGSSPR